ncbi:unnamed protein product [Ranitomeya imitator]|uniref:G-protein coupled receptors family 1 profile domain-containing protein n=1 Tax=Ranitomeya imitator TaxID=111125 RepID=A0ABN9MR88_9NEOB|nr:unnamed protein product [Ranitomeya imitator]
MKKKMNKVKKLMSKMLMMMKMKVWEKEKKEGEGRGINEPTRKERVYFNSDILVPLTCIGIGYRYRRYPIFFEYRPIQTDTDTFRYRKMYKNKTIIEYFILEGFSDSSELHLMVFVAVLFVYLIVLGGNMMILILIGLEHHLHTPMYFFLANLSIIDISFTTSMLFKIFTSFLTRDKTISFQGCMIQSFMAGSFTIHELHILTAMSYDRYVAICIPLRYQLVMNKRTCVVLASLCWILGFLFICPHTLLLSGFSCYTSIEVNHFLCDIILLMKMTCSDTSVLEILFFIEGWFLFTIFPFLLTFVPYIFIIFAILKIHTTMGRSKAFYTCSSHLTIVTLLYSINIIQYMIPSNLDYKKLYTLINTVVVPLLNPLIYSLKNKDMKNALRRRRMVWCKISF